MFCRNCGSNIPDGSSFCTVCGSPVDAGISSQPAHAPAFEPKPVALPQSASAPKNKIKVKTVISIFLLLAIIGMSVFSYVTLFGIDGKWEYSRSEKHNETIIPLALENKGAIIEFSSGNVNVIYPKALNIKNETYTLKDNQLYFNNKPLFDIKSDMLEMTISGKLTNKIIYKRVFTAQYWIYGGAILAMIIGLIVNLITGRKQKDTTTGAVSESYSISVNPTKSKPVYYETDQATNYNDVTADSISYNNETNTDSVINTTMKDEDVFATQYAVRDSGQERSLEQIYNDSDDTKTKYASNPIEPHKSIEILFSAENNIPVISPEEYTFTPGMSEKKDASAELNPIDTVDETKNSEDIGFAVEPTVDAAINYDTPTVSETPTVPEVSAAPVTPEIQPVQKPSSSPFFKSAGDL